MNLLIIGTARSGTTSLLTTLAGEVYHKVNEPFLVYPQHVIQRINNSKLTNKIEARPKEYPLTELDEYESVCVKTIVDQIPDVFKKSECDIENTKLFLNEFSQNFDKIILLDRLNLDEHWFSMLNLLYKMWGNPKDVKGEWNKHSPFAIWYKEDIPTNWDKKMKDGGFYDGFIKSKQLLNKISEHFDLPIFYYENLYSKNKEHQTTSLEKLCSYLGDKSLLKQLIDGLNPNKKLLQLNKKNLI